MKRKELKNKIRFLLAGIILVFLVLIVKISFLQLVQTERYRTLARDNYIRIVPVFAPRGEIFDRDGQKIVTNRPIYTVSINDVNLKGTTYHVWLERVGADTVQMIDQLAGVLARDREYCQGVDAENGEFAREYADSLARDLGHVVCIAYRNEIISVSGGFEKELLKKPIGKDLKEAINNRQTKVLEGNHNLTTDDQVQFKNSVVSPIIANGDVIGAVIIITNEDVPMGDLEKKKVENAASSLAPELLQKLIGEKITQLIQEHKTALEEGQQLELAVAYNPATEAGLSGPQWNSYGIRVEKKTDMLSKLVNLLFEKEAFEEDSTYAVEQKIRTDFRGKMPYETVLVAEDISLEAVVELRERKLEFPGVQVDIKPVRDYPYKELLVHVLGYVQNIKSEQYQKHKDDGYLMTDLYGQNGLEYEFEGYLRGEHGAWQVEVNSNNQAVRDLGKKEAVPGNDLVLTVDLELQMAAEKALAEGVERAKDAGYKSARAGAAVVMDVNSGAILAMASYPSYPPGIFAGGLSNSKWQELQESRALINRAMALYPPGSTFKMVTAAAILENNVVDPEYKMPDPGYYMLGSHAFHDWKPGGHGRVDMRRALQVSCDTYFYRFGRSAGVEAIAKYAREFGLGEKTGIELPGEGSSVVADRDSKINQRLCYLSSEARKKAKEIKQRYDELLSKTTDHDQRKDLLSKRSKELQAIHSELVWHDYDTVNASIGQGDNLYTPLQLVTYVSAIANGGKLYKPYLVSKVVSPEDALVEEFGREERKKVNIKPENLQIIREGMNLVTKPSGTAGGVFSGFSRTAAAKTGTSELGNGEDNHALFVAYAPYEKPEVAVAVVLEHGHAGSGYAGPIARDILDAYFGADLKQLFPGDEQQGPGAGEEGTLGDTGTISTDRPDELQAAIERIPAINWPDGDDETDVTPAPEDERIRYYQNRLKRPKSASVAAKPPARRASGNPQDSPPRELEPEPGQSETPGNESTPPEEAAPDQQLEPQPGQSEPSGDEGTPPEETEPDQQLEPQPGQSEPIGNEGTPSEETELH